MRQICFAHLATASVLIMLAAAAAAQETAGPRKLPMPQPANLDIAKPSAGVHEVTVEMNVGDIEIVRSLEENQIRLMIRAGFKQEEDAMQTWVRRFDVTNNAAYITIKLPKETNHRSPAVTVYVPAQATLRAHLGIGDMHVRGIKGDKTVDVGIGDLTISASDADEYSEVRANTHIGDISDSLSRHSDSLNRGGWLGQHERTTSGAGKYKLQAHVGIGDVKIERESDKH